MAEAIEAFRSTLRLDPMRASAYVRLKETYSRSQAGDQVRAELRQRTDQDETDFVQRHLWIILLTVVSTMGVALMWLMQRRRLSQCSEAAPGK